MNYFIYLVTVLIFIFAGYLFGRKYLVPVNSLRCTEAIIEAIHLQKVGEVWTPEVIIDYSFEYGADIYYGKDFMRIDELTSDSQFLLIDKMGFPVLMTEENEYYGEEHIETWIMEKRKTVSVEYSTLLLPKSRIKKISESRDTLFQNVSVKFPWMS